MVKFGQGVLVVAMMCLMLGGCAAGTPPGDGKAAPKDQGKPPRIQWLGHSCFVLTSSQGTKVMIDPYHQNMGYTMPPVEPDFITVSHEHSDHNTVSAAKGKPQVIKGVGESKLQDITAKGIATFHDAEQGSKRGANTVFVYDVDGFRICHLGDLGHLLSDAQKAAIGKVDVLIVPVGGNYTIDAAGAKDVCAQLEPPMIIPMHYKTAVNPQWAGEGVDPFLEKMGGGKKIQATYVDLKKDELASLKKAVYVLEFR